jgi:hypothetical protein
MDDFRALSGTISCSENDSLAFGRLGGAILAFIWDLVGVLWLKLACCNIIHLSVIDAGW